MAVNFDRFSYIYPRSSNKALEDITLTIPEGSYTVITGPSGAGKTTLCLAIAGAVPQYYGGQMAGQVTVAGVSAARVGIADLAYEVGTVLADYETQLVTMTVAEEVAFGLENRGCPSQEISTRVKEALALVGLADMDDREVASLSGGQKQRLVIASVLATEPAILVLDEPASALDPEGAEELYALLGKLNRAHGKTIVVVEHDLARILPFASQLVVMESGCIRHTGMVADTLTYMYHQGVYREAVPPLWQLKLGLEAGGKVQLGNWMTEADAARELMEALAKRKEVGKSA